MDWAWWEAENAAETNSNQHAWASGTDDPDVPSGGKLLANDLSKGAGQPGNAVFASYSIDVPSSGEYTLWVRKWGSYGVSRWRFGEGEWHGTERSKPRGLRPGEKTRSVLTIMGSVDLVAPEGRYQRRR